MYFKKWLQIYFYYSPSGLVAFSYIRLVMYKFVIYFISIFFVASALVLFYEFFLFV